MAFVIQPLSGRHDRSSFDCGEPALDEFLRRYARQNEERGIGRTFVAVPDGQTTVVGFYTLAAGSVAFVDLPGDVHLPRYPVPVVLLARLAVSRMARGQGLGEALLVDAFRRILAVADTLGIHAVEVRAKSERARTFYERYGFSSLRDDRLHMYVPLTTVRKALG
jgi:ribosomal protein S18 acetylase RimI-like enzyme